MERVFDSTANIKFPAWPPVKIALEKIKQEYLEKGDLAGYDLCCERYDGLTYKDVEIESIAEMKDGRLKICFVARTRGFARYDLRILPVKLRTILDEYEMVVPEFENLDELRGYLSNRTNNESVIIFNKWNQTFGVVIGTEAQIGTVPDVMGGIRFDKIVARVADYDVETMTSGDMTVIDKAIGQEVVALYIRDQYRPPAPDGDDLTVTRRAMTKGVTTLKFQLGKKIPDPVWTLNLTHPDFTAGELVIAEDKMSATLELTLKKKDYYPGKREIKGTLDINGTVFDIDQGFQHNPPYRSQYGAGNYMVWTQILAEFGYSGTQANQINIVSNFDIKFDDGDGPKELSLPVTRRTNSGSFLKLYMDFPGFHTEGEFEYELMIEGQELDSTNYMVGTGQRYLPMPNGATGIIAIPEEIIKTEVEYVFTAKVKVTFNDPARSPVLGRIDYSATITTDIPGSERFNIKATDEGYELKFTNLSEVDIKSILNLCKVTAYAYSGYPSTYFEHRYGYTGPEGVVVEWERMTNSYKRGVFKYINANGVTDTQKVWKKINMMDGIWSTWSDFKPVTVGVGVYTTLDMHIVDYNRPAEGLTRFTFSLDGVQNDLDVQFKYTPVDIGSITQVFNPETKMWTWTVKLPEDGITSDKLIVERDYNYGDEGTMTSGWITDKTDVDEKTVTFTTRSGWGDKTSYRIQYSNQDDLTSVYFARGLLDNV